MTPYYKIVDKDGHVPGFGTNGPDEYEGLVKISKTAYNELLSMMKSRPDSAKAPKGYDWILNDKPLEWVQIEVPEDDPEPEKNEKED